MPSSVEFIGDRVFVNCKSLESIVIPEGVKSIGEECFFDCGNLKSVVIPSSVKSIGEYSFDRCNKLTDIYVDQEKNDLLLNTKYPKKCIIHWNSKDPTSL
ncbi:leucine-rich repeat domain-containing protein [Bullifex sp.]|uniref:leucine-rich repeat domain-containing protein n=1 Tax=Bullifex sp. TaxID=2815808 RepID=UPI0039C0FFAE